MFIEHPLLLIVQFRKGGMTEKMRGNGLLALGEHNYPKYRGQIIELYLHAFTGGEYAQYIDPPVAGSTLDGLIRNGWGNMLFVGDRLAGVALAMPLLQDSGFPAADLPSIPVERSLYISEVMVHAAFRGRGIAAQLVNDLLVRAESDYTDAVIRVWDRNKPALSLYRKLGFYPVGSIWQTKLKSPGETFEMKKIYLHRYILAAVQ